ncbi:hypothetical protein C8Q76DRAFT_4057 [Earliella scabrosa]|nr:hypothetical protein C8Q76DRAFT_4057 [Earliella scabrosa]
MYVPHDGREAVGNTVKSCGQPSPSPWSLRDIRLRFTVDVGDDEGYEVTPSWRFKLIGRIPRLKDP